MRAKPSAQGNCSRGVVQLPVGPAEAFIHRAQHTAALTPRARKASWLLVSMNAMELEQEHGFLWINSLEVLMLFANVGPLRSDPINQTKATALSETLCLTQLQQELAKQSN